MHTRKEKIEALGRLLDIQYRLRKECPWDKKQTFESLRPNTIEEVYELTAAISKQDRHEVMKELGDVLEHVVFYAMLGEEEGAFDMADVCNQQSDKLMFRHPFIDWNDCTMLSEAMPRWTVSQSDMVINEKGQVVYKDEASTQVTGEVKTDSDVEQTWEQIKQRERGGNTSVLSGVPRSLPSVIKAYRIQDKARAVGFDWEKPEDVWTKVKEEIGEFETELRSGTSETMTEELGDLLFSIINAARLYHLNPENALENTNQKFIRRFEHIEQRAKEMQRDLSSFTLQEMDDLWNEAKQAERNQK